MLSVVRSRSRGRKPHLIWTLLAPSTYKRALLPEISDQFADETLDPTPSAPPDVSSCAGHVHRRRHLTPMNRSSPHHPAAAAIQSGAATSPSLSPPARPDPRSPWPARPSRPRARSAPPPPESSSAAASSLLPHRSRYPYPVVHCKRWTSLIHGAGPGSFHRLLSLHRRCCPPCRYRSYDRLVHGNRIYPPTWPSAV